MRKYLDLDINRFVTAPGSQIPDEDWSFMRGVTGETIELSFVKDGEVYELPDASANGTFILKEASKRDGIALANASFWSKSGSDTSTVYTFAINLETDELNDLLGHDEDDSNDVLSISVEGQVLWIESGKVYKSPIIVGSAIHDVNSGDESSPTTASGTFFLTQAIPSGQAYVDFTIPEGSYDLIPWGIERAEAATDADTAPGFLSVQRTSSTTARGYLTGAPSISGYKAFLFLKPS